MVRAGRVTAVEHVDALAGITRDSVIQLVGADTRKLAGWARDLIEADGLAASAQSAPLAL